MQRTWARPARILAKTTDQEVVAMGSYDVQSGQSVGSANNSPRKYARRHVVDNIVVEVDPIEFEPVDRDGTPLSSLLNGSRRLDAVEGGERL